MKTKTIELYEFDELPKDIQKKVIEKNSDINTDYEWHDLSIDEWKNQLQEMGFNNPEIHFRGFYSQGDGASFTCKSVDVDKFLTHCHKRTEFKAILNGMNSGSFEPQISLSRIDHYYSHEYTVTADSDIWYNFEPRNYSTIQDLEIKLRGLVLDEARKLMRQIYKELETEYEYLTSYEAIRDTIKANEYTFTLDGEMENA